MTKESILKLSVVEAWKGVEDFRDFVDASGNNVTRVGDVAYWGPKEMEAAVGSARDSPVERVEDGGIERGTSMNERFAGVEGKANSCTLLLQVVVGFL